uniref:Sema domain-containing protein n=1 Tax=Meloidogyne hapla TaxID=6305 RepID=A0A1I8BTP2_MELHA
MYYIEGLHALNEDDNFVILTFYGSSLLAQIHSINEYTGHELSKNSDMKWVETKRTIFGIADSLGELDKENRIILGNSNLNELYLTNLAYIDEKNFNFPDYLKRKKEMAEVIL